MGTARTNKRREQRKRNRAVRHRRAAIWAALSPEQQAMLQRDKGRLDEMNRLAYAWVKPMMADLFAESPFYRELRRR